MDINFEQIISIAIILATIFLIYSTSKKSVEKFDVNQLIFEKDEKIDFAEFNNRPIINASYGAFDENNRPIVEDGDRLVDDVTEVIVDAQRNNKKIKVKNSDLTDGVDPAKNHTKKLIVYFETPVNFTWSNAKLAKSATHPQYTIVRVSKSLCNASGACRNDQECYQLNKDGVGVDNRFFCFDKNPVGDFTVNI